MDEKEIEKNQNTFYTYIGDIALAEKVKKITTISVIIFIVAAVFIVTAIVLFFIMENLLWPTLVLVAGVIIAVIAGLVRSIRGGKYERQYKSLSSLNLGKESYGKYETSSEEKYQSLVNLNKHDQDVYKYFTVIEFIIAINKHVTSVSSKTHDFKRNGFTYSITLDNGTSNNITINPLNDSGDTLTRFLDSYIEKEIVEEEIKEVESLSE